MLNYQQIQDIFKVKDDMPPTLGRFKDEAYCLKLQQRVVELRKAGLTFNKIGLCVGVSASKANNLFNESSH